MIVAAARRKGIEFAHVQWVPPYPTPGGVVGCWEFEFSDEMEEAIALADPEFDGFTPDISSTTEALEWIETLPSLLCDQSHSRPGGE